MMILHQKSYWSPKINTFWWFWLQRTSTYSNFLVCFHLDGKNPSTRIWIRISAFIRMFPTEPNPNVHLYCYKASLYFSAHLQWTNSKQEALQYESILKLSISRNLCLQRKQCQEHDVCVFGLERDKNDIYTSLATLYTVCGGPGQAGQSGKKHSKCRSSLILEI